MNKSTYKPREYSDRAFSSDSKLQSSLVDEMRLVERRAKSSFVAMAVLFAVSLAFALIGFPIVIPIAIPVFAVLTAFGVYHLLPRRRFCCGNCASKMSIKWETRRNGKGARFVICQKCKLYADTLWTSR